MIQQLSTHACIWKFNHIVVLLLWREVRLTILGDRTKFAAFTQIELFTTLRKNVCSIVSYPVVHEEVKGRGKEGINFKSGAVSREPRGTSRCGRPQSWLPWLSAGTSWLDVLVKGQSWTALSRGGSGPRPLSNFPASCNLRQCKKRSARND